MVGTWLKNLHRDLDRAVLAAYRWSNLAEARLGVPLSQSGRQRKVDRELGCSVLVTAIGAGWAVLRILV